MAVNARDQCSVAEVLCVLDTRGITRVSSTATHPARGHVFSSANGAPLRRRNFYRRHFRPAVEGVPERAKAQGRAARPEIPSPLPEDKRRLRFHDPRHTRAALLIAQSAHAKEIHERLGHSTIRLTFDRYGHLLPSLDERFCEHGEAVYQEAHAAWSPSRG
ncbi:MAG: tyrosine-type recombinase/integrase [Egibacteraceae bacterium]